MINGIHHIAISTGNLQRALEFYRDLMGFAVVRDGEWSKGTSKLNRIMSLQDSSAKMAMVDARNIVIEIFEFESPAPKPGDPDRPVCDHGYTHICLNTSDVEAEYERLTAAGMRFHCPPQRLGTDKVTYGRDPDGNVIELLETGSLKK